MNIIDLINKQQDCEGVFTLPGGDSVQGRIILDPQYDHSIILRVVNSQEQLFRTPELKEAIIHGRLNNGLCLTLIGSTSTRSKCISSLPYYHIYCHSLFRAHPHQVLRLDCCEIKKIRFKLSHSRGIFPLYMKSVSPKNRRKILKMIIGDAYRSNDREYSFDRVYYCGGVTDIISCNTSHGHFRVRPYQVTTLPYIDVEFVIETHSQSSLLSDAESAIECVTRFFWLITGTRQYAENIQIDVKDPDDGVTHSLDTHFLLQEAPLFTSDTTQEALGSLIDPINNRIMFEECLSTWSNLTKQKRAACDVILSQFNESMHSPFRIARDATAYEWFDDSPNELDTDDDARKKRQIMDHARREIKRKYQKHSNARSYVLSKLVITPKRRTLIDKINSRLCKIRNYLPEEIRESIDGVVIKAVSARNEYIHDRTSMLSGQDSLYYVYMAKTLEFIFLSSVLVECGWDMKSWLAPPDSLENLLRQPNMNSISPSMDSYNLKSRGFRRDSHNTLLHSFSNYIIDYSQLYDVFTRAVKQAEL